jgi:hypothetical protein
LLARQAFGGHRPPLQPERKALCLYLVKTSVG